MLLGFPGLGVPDPCVLALFETMGGGHHPIGLDEHLGVLFMPLARKQMPLGVSAQQHALLLNGAGVHFGTLLHNDRHAKKIQ